MIKNISLIEYEKCYPKRLKRIFEQGLQYNSYKNFIPKTENAVVGNIPNEIIKLFKPTERQEKIKLFKEALSETAKYIREIYDKNMINVQKDDKFRVDNILDCQGIKAKSLLNDKLKNILPSGYTSDFEYIDYGGFKDVYRLSIKDYKNKKVMHDKAFHVYRNLYQFSEIGSRHGIWAEPNMWIYLSYRAGHSLNNTQFTKHYISDLHSGYSLTEYIDKDIPKTTKPLPTEDILGVIYNDKKHNPLIFNKIYDIGGFKKDSLFTDDKMVTRYFKQIYNRNSEKEKQQVIAQLEDKIKNPKTPHRGKMETAIKLYREKQTMELKKEVAIKDFLSEL